MVDCENLESYQYIKALKTYLEGDLKSFDCVAAKCEEEESKEYNNTPAEVEEQLLSSTTTSETTKMPSMREAKSEKSSSELLQQDLNVPKFFRSTIPHTLTLFSTADVVGYFLRGGNENETAKNFEEFFADKVPKDEMKVLIDVYRHGMSHGYFPKLGVGISYHSENQDKKLFFLDSEASLTLNVNELKRIVLNRLEEILNDCNAVEPMEESYKELIDRYNSKTKSAINSLTEKLKNESKSKQI